MDDLEANSNQDSKSQGKSVRSKVKKDPSNDDQVPIDESEGRSKSSKEYSPESKKSPKNVKIIRKILNEPRSRSSSKEKVPNETNVAKDQYQLPSDSEEKKSTTNLK